MPGERLREQREPGRPGEEVGEPRRARSRGAPSGGSIRSACADRGRQPALVVVGEELGLVRRHVHADRALRLAGLAGEAQVEGAPDLLALPAAADDLAPQHLEEQARAAARRVLLLAGRAEARAHRAAVVAPALAHADAAERRAREVAAVLREAEDRRAARRARQPARGAGSPRWDSGPRAFPDSSGPSGSQMRLNSRNASISSGPEHLRQQLRARLPVAVLAGERSAVARRRGPRPRRRTRGTARCPRRFRGRNRGACGRSRRRSGRRDRRDSRGSPRGGAGRAGRRRAVSGATAESSQPSHVSGRPGGMRRRGQAGLPHAPHAALLLGPVKTRVRGAGLPRRARPRASGALPRRPRRVAAPSSTRSQPPPSGSSASPSGCRPAAAHVGDEAVVEPLETRRPVREHLRHGVGRREDVGKARDDAARAPAGSGSDAASPRARWRRCLPSRRARGRRGTRSRAAGRAGCSPRRAAGSRKPRADRRRRAGRGARASAA